MSRVDSRAPDGASDALDSDVAALLQRGAPRPPLPDDVATRLAARAARATLLGGLFSSLAAKIVLASGATAVVVAGSVALLTPAALPPPPETPAARTPAAPETPETRETVAAPPSQPTLELELPPANATSSSSSSSSSSLAARAASEAEVSLLETARMALAQGDVDAAQAALGRHASRFPRGALREEREALRVVALGRQHSPDVAAAARAFRTRFPKSPFLPLINAAVDAAAR